MTKEVITNILVMTKEIIMVSVYNVKWKSSGDKIGLISTETYLDIIDVTSRACGKFNIESPREIDIEYIGDMSSI